VPVNCGGLSETVLESELFGHERGAFTGADRQHVGCFERAGRGTLFLDEIGELSPASQARFLRVLESHEFTRVGGEQPIPMQARIVAATHRDLEALCRDGKFRQDLYHRLDLHPICLPPLRQRLDDLQELVEHLLELVCTEEEWPVPHVTEAALSCLRAYPWPGNVRQLRTVLNRAVVQTSQGILDAEHLPACVTAFPVPGSSVNPQPLTPPSGDAPAAVSVDCHHPPTIRPVELNADRTGIRKPLKRQEKRYVAKKGKPATRSVCVCY
jgi:DNA-binding NtrC family response regulator